MQRRAYFKLYNQQRRQLRSAQKQLCRLRDSLEALSDNSSMEATQLTKDISRQVLFVDALKKATKEVVQNDKMEKQVQKQEEKQEIEVYQPSEYEKLRDKNMRKNQEFLVSIGIHSRDKLESKKNIEGLAPVEDVAVKIVDTDPARKLWLTVGDDFLTGFMVPPLEKNKRIPVGSLVGVCFDISPGYFFGVIGAKRKMKGVVGHSVHYTDGDEGWLPISQLRLLVVNEDKVLAVFPDVRTQIENEMGKGEVLK